MDYENGPETLIDAIMFIMIFKFPNVEKFRICDLHYLIINDEWCWKTTTFCEISEKINQFKHLFSQKDNKIWLNDDGIKKALKVNYA